VTSETPQNETPKAEQNGHTTPRAILPITVTHPEQVEASALRLFQEPDWHLRLTIEGDRSYLRPKLVRATPLSDPERYICFMDDKNEEICMIDALDQLDEESRRLAREALDQRYLTAVIQRIESMRNEFGTSYWDVQTDRGQREFVVQNVAENAQWLSDTRLLLIDVDGNRFEIPDVALLDKHSVGLIDQVL
jgi:hypothetical protein